MRPIIPVSEMASVDASSPLGVDVLMDRAGYAVAGAAAGMGIGYGSTVVVLCGPGNNGGDGYVAGRYLLDRGAQLIVAELATPDPDSAAGRARSHAIARGVRVVPLTTIDPHDRCDLVVDAVFGTGFHGSLPDEIVVWATSGHRVLSVDIPSGVAGDTGTVEGSAFVAERTVTFHARKPGHVLGVGPDHVGELRVVDIGLAGGHASMHLMDEADVVDTLRPRTAHKWRVGAVATVGGMPGLTGAALFAARAAMAAGAGVSTILTTAATAATYEALAPDITAMQASESATWHDHASEVLSLLDRYDVLVVGPGLEPAPPMFVDRLLERFDGPMVVDAGAVTSITRLDTIYEREAPTVLTPHAGEFARFTGLEPTVESAARIAEGTGSVVVLKGNPTFVAGERVVVVDRGGPELASIGTGDVLAGTVGAFLARGIAPESAAASAAWIHGQAGRTLAERRRVSAPALITEIGRTLARREAASGGAAPDAGAGA